MKLATAKWLGSFLVLLFAVTTQAQQVCRQIFIADRSAHEILNQYREDLLNPGRSRVRTSYGTDVPIVRAFEKEGLFYEEIASWFPVLRAEAKDQMRKVLAAETASSSRNKPLTKMLRGLRALEGESNPGIRSMTPAQKLELILTKDNPFSVLSLKFKSMLFVNSIITFDHVGPGPNTPKNITVGDDLGSYEVRSRNGNLDQKDFLSERQQAEDFLQGKVGHQHLFHAWPRDAVKRKEMAPAYIELLDSSSWFLFWRQMKRNPEEVSSILAHPYLGVYTRDSLNRLHRAVENDQPQKFRDKFRMIGARSFKASAEIPGQTERSEFTPDWEARSGNKGAARDFIEGILISRLETGDYSNLKDYRTYDFNPSAPIREIAQKTLRESDIKILEDFEKSFTHMNFSAHSLAKNHVRNKIISPLLAWENRFPLGAKVELLKSAQAEYAKALVTIGQRHLDAWSKARSTQEKAEINQKTLEDLEVLIYEFASKTRLDHDIGTYLNPRPKELPSLRFAAGPILNIMNVSAGMEYSFRFPVVLKPTSKIEAEQKIGGLASTLARALGSAMPTKTATDAAHGHGISVKYTFPDQNQRIWRVEWDGIQRNYVDGKVTEAWGGHVEIPTPKILPSDLAPILPKLFDVTRDYGYVPSRTGGGAHYNFDLKPLKTLPVAQGTRAITNLITYFETRAPIIMGLWTHPGRYRAAWPFETRVDFLRKLENFKGDWKDLGKLLYDERYFNTNVGRKPKYVPVNLTSLMTESVPREFLESNVDIRNAKQEWKPDFAKVEDRGEARFYDAPTDAYMATLQLKHWMAVMNHAFNTPNAIKPQKIYSYEDMQAWLNDPIAFAKAVEGHLKEIGLDPQEFQPLIWNSYMNLVSGQSREMPTYTTFDGFQ